jgi:hypothetical protein
MAQDRRFPATFGPKKPFRSHRTGAVVNPAMLRFPFPPQWHSMSCEDSSISGSPG